MAKTRLELQALLKEILKSENVYFEPPESVKMQYPAIRYSRNRIENTKAENRTYKQDVSYSLTYISRTPEDSIIFALSNLPFCRHDRHFKADNLSHDVYTIYI